MNSIMEYLYSVQLLLRTVTVIFAIFFQPLKISCKHKYLLNTYCISCMSKDFLSKCNLIFYLRGNNTKTHHQIANACSSFWSWPPKCTRTQCLCIAFGHLVYLSCLNPQQPSPFFLRKTRLLINSLSQCFTCWVYSRCI